MATYIINEIVIDTLNAVQDAAYVKNEANKGKTGYEEWKDFGIGIYNFILQLKQFGETVLIVGPYGKGKTYGTKFLDAGSWLFYNCDNKNLTYKNDNFKELYGTKKDPGMLHRIGYDFKQIITELTQLKLGITTKNGDTIKLGDDVVIFAIAHDEEYKSKDGMIKSRLKVQGKLATKMGISGLVNYYFIPELKSVNNKIKYSFKTNSVDNSDEARSSEGCFDTYIDNNFKFIATKIREYNG